MPKPKILHHVQARLETSDYQLFEEWRAQNGLNGSEAVRALIVMGLKEDLDFEELGYRDGLRRALHETRARVEGALEGLFEGER